MRRGAFGLALGLAGCPLPGPFGQHPPPVEVGPPELVSIELLCDPDKDGWKLAATSTGFSGGGQSQWTEDGRYVELHTVPVVSSAVDGSAESLSLSLAIVPDWRLQVDGASTVFTCGDAPSVSFALLDATGEFAACATFADPASDPVLGCPSG